MSGLDSVKQPRAHYPETSSVRLKLYKTLTDHTDEITACAFSRSHLVTLSRDNSLILYDYPSLEKTKTVSLGKQSFPRALAASRDGKYFGVALENHVFMLEGPDFQTRAQLPLQDTFNSPSVDFSSDGSRVAVASGHHLALYTLPDFELERSIESDTSLAHAAFSPDSKHLLVSAVTGYKHNALASLHDVPSFQTIKRREEDVESRAGPCGWSPDGKYAVAVQDQRFWVAADCTLTPYAFVNGLPVMSPLKPIKAHEKEIFSVAFSPDGKYLASVSGKDAILHEMPEFEKVAQLQSDYDPAISGSRGGFTHLSWSPDSKLLAVADEGRFEYRATGYDKWHNERVSGGHVRIYQVK